LYEVPEKGGDQQPEGNQNEERPARNPGHMRTLRHKSIPHRQITPDPSRTVFIQQQSAIACIGCVALLFLIVKKKSGPSQQV